MMVKARDEIRVKGPHLPDGIEERRNPYLTSGPPTMRPSVVCFADILGYASRSQKALDDGQGQDFLRRIHGALSTAHERIRDYARGYDQREHFSVEVFTDSIVVGYPVDVRDFGEPEMGRVFNIFAELQTSLAMEGYFLRGGIACGRHFMDRDVVFGDALLQAVGLDKAGGPPRLSLAPSAVELVRRHVRFYLDPEDSPQYRRLLQDADGTWFINYLADAFVAFPDRGIFMNVLEAHRESVVQGLEKYRSLPDVRAKFEWAARYHNFVCRDFLERHPIPASFDDDPEYSEAVVEAHELANHLVDIEALAAQPRRITLAPERGA